MKMYYYRKIRRFLINKLKLRKLKKYYSKENPKKAANHDQMLVYMCDGRIHHGGLADRLSGLVSVYDYCKENDKEFKANFIFPYKLQDILEPNLYDWTIDEDELSYNSAESEPKYITYKFSIPDQQKYARKELNSGKRQLHVYTNMKYNYPTNFKYSFRELFKPSRLLQKAIDAEKAKLPKGYVSVTFRFQQLLGDLKEGNFPKISDEAEKEMLINRCLEFVERVHKLHPELEKILVTSDSTTFLDRASKFPYVHIIAGKIVHMDFDGYNSGVDVHLKSFVDLFMIAGARKVYNVVMPPLYKTSFPYVASLITGAEYIELT